MSVRVKESLDLHCCLSGRLLPIEEAVFLTLSPEGALMLDLNRQLPGKHACLECKREVIESAISKGVLKEFFGEEIRSPADFPEKIFAMLRKKAIEMLCMAKKSGSLTYGFEKVMAASKAGEADFILQASDGKEGGKEKIGLNTRTIRIFSVFSSQELGKVIGRGRVVHMAILKNNANMSVALVTIITKVQNF